MFIYLIIMVNKDTVYPNGESFFLDFVPTSMGWTENLAIFGRRLPGHVKSMPHVEN